MNSILSLSGQDKLPTCSQLHTLGPFIGTCRGYDSLRKRVKVEFQDDKGTKYSLAVEGRISREKVLKIMDLMELVEGNDAIEEPAMDETTTFGRVFKIIETSYQ